MEKIIHTSPNRSKSLSHGQNLSKSMSCQRTQNTVKKKANGQQSLVLPTTYRILLYSLDSKKRDRSLRICPF